MVGRTFEGDHSVVKDLAHDRFSAKHQTPQLTHKPRSIGIILHNVPLKKNARSHDQTTPFWVALTATYIAYHSNWGNIKPSAVYLSWISWWFVDVIFRRVLETSKCPSHSPKALHSNFDPANNRSQIKSLHFEIISDKIAFLCRKTMSKIDRKKHEIKVLA